MKSLSLLQIGNFVALIATLIMNGLSNSGIFPNTVGDLGNSRAIFFLPETYVFAIWGVIYVGLIGFAIYQLRPVAKANGTVDRVGYWFVLSCLANITWLVLFLYDLVWLSTVAMLVILYALIMIYRRLGIGQRTIDWQERWAAHIPFGIYLGWISVATIANFSTALYVSDQVTSFLGIGADVWAVLLMVIATLLAMTMLVQRGDIAYALVVVWALVGIYVREFDTELYRVLEALNAELVNFIAIGAAVVIVVLILIYMFVNRSRQQQAA